MAARQRGHPRVEDAGETRRTILRVAHELFMERGYRAVSTRQIAEACGLTQPALYHHFADKQSLYVAVLREELAALNVGLERIARRGGSLHDRLRQVVRFLPTERQDMSQMFHDIDRELDVEARGALEVAFFESVVTPIAAIFADGLRVGALRTPSEGGVDPVSGAFLLLSMLRYAAHSRSALPSLHGQDVSHAQPSATVVRVLLHGLAAPDAPIGAEDDETPASAPT